MIVGILVLAIVLQTGIFVFLIDQTEKRASDERRRLLEMRVHTPEVQFTSPPTPRPRAVPTPPADIAAFNSIGSIKVPSEES